MSTPIKTVLIYGYGVMGRGVAKTFADAGFATLVKSSRAGKLEGLPAKTSVVEQLPKEAPKPGSFRKSEVVADAGAGQVERKP